MIAAAEKDRLNEVVPAKDVRQVYHEQMIKEKNGNLVKKDAQNRIKKLTIINNISRQGSAYFSTQNLFAFFKKKRSICA